MFREGLLPYVEAVAGSRRYCKAASHCSFLALLSSVVGTLLSFYLCFMEAYTLLTPLNLLLFLLLWLVPAFLISDGVNHF